MPSTGNMLQSLISNINSLTGFNYTISQATIWYILMVQGNAQSPKSRCLAVAKIFCWSLIIILTGPIIHRNPQEFILRFARNLVFGYYSIIKIYMAAAGSKIPVPPKETNSYFPIYIGTWYWHTQYPHISADENGVHLVNSRPWGKNYWHFVLTKYFRYIL